MGKKKRNRNKHSKEYKQHSGGRPKYKSVKDWPDPEEYDDNVVPLRKPNKPTKRQRRSARYHAAIEAIAFEVLGGYYWSGSQQEELHDDTHTEAGG